MWWFRKFGRTWVKSQCKWGQRGLWSEQKLRGVEGLASHLIWTGLRNSWGGVVQREGGQGLGEWEVWYPTWLVRAHWVCFLGPQAESRFKT